MAASVSFLLFFSVCSVAIAYRNFAIDYDQQTFMKDGRPFRYISGTLHYFQVPRELWRDRMLRIRALGCNALQTYAIWNRHQLSPDDEYTFDDNANISEYLLLAQELGFVVILRIGPYIDAEVDFGGFPYWLLKKKDVVLRTSKDDWYLKVVKEWLTFLLLKIVKPLLYSNNGPIIMVQIENEYGSYPDCDKKYMIWMRELARGILGNDTILMTTDGASADYLRCGTVPDVFPTIDFGVSSKDQVEKSFSYLRRVLPHGPLVNSEFYPGWFDQWGNAKHITIPTDGVLDTMRYMWELNVTSFNIYPVHGGTHWGYAAGGEGPPFRTVTTGYDFDAPISECGDTTPKFVAMRKLIEELTGKEISDRIPESPPKYAYGRVRMEWFGTILDLLYSLTPAHRIVNSTFPLTMEEVDHAYGFILYETEIPKTKGQLSISGVHDRAYVIIDGQLAGVIQRKGNDTLPTVIQLSRLSKSVKRLNSIKLQILVENQGRICFGRGIYDRKGLINNVTLDGHILTNWTMYPIDLSLIHKIDKNQMEEAVKSRSQKTPMDKSGKYLPSVYFGYYPAPKNVDTFFDPSGWGKGQLFINGRNIGRYWPVAGPQITLYVPGVYLRGYNQVYMFELDQPGNCDTSDDEACWIKFGDRPLYNEI